MTQDSRAITSLRSYSVPGFSDTSVTISEAVQTALAATNPPLQTSVSNSFALGGKALAVEVENEAAAVWCSRPPDPTSLVLCFVSIAAKEARKRRADEFQEVVSHISDERYFRFDLDRVLAEDGLAYEQWLASVQELAEDFVAGQRTIMRHCVLTLKGKQSESARRSSIRH
jgi:hypothetical protein